MISRSPFCLTAALAATLVLSGCADRSGREAVDPRVTDTSRPLVFITHPTDPPCAWTNAQGECFGTDVDLARRIAAKMGRELVCEADEFENLIPRLKAGTADLAIATITITPARQKDVDFSKPYATGGSCFLYRADGPKPRMSQIATMRIGIEAGTTCDLYLSRHGGNPIRFVNMSEAVEALNSEEIDAIFFDAIPLREWAERSGGKLVVTPLETREGYGVAVDKRRPDVLAAANAVIEEEGRTE